MLAPAGHVSRLNDFRLDPGADAAAATTSLPPPPRTEAPEMTPYARSERLFRYELALIFSAMLIVLVVFGALLFLGDH